MTKRLAAILLATIAAASLACTGEAVVVTVPATAEPAASNGSGEPIRIGPTAAGQQVNFTLGLRVNDEAVARFLSGVNDRSSANYHQFLSAAEFGQRFGVGHRAMARVV
ncbi:MAG: protease pro-enzyme activation domain-containing protein, partial [Candidatus Limnocylindrales bacterium]